MESINSTVADTNTIKLSSQMEKPERRAAGLFLISLLSCIFHEEDVDHAWCILTFI